MQTTFDQYLESISQWLNQSIALYWPVSVLLVALVAFLVVTRRQRHKLASLQGEREQLTITQATNAQKISQLESDNGQLLGRVDANTQQINQLLAKSAQLESSRDEKAQQLSDNEKERMGLREMHENNQRKIARMDADIREQNAHLQAEKNKLVELKTEYERQKTELKNEFKVVSEEIIKERQAMLTEHNKEGLGNLLKPLQAQIEGFQKRVNEVHDESVKGNTSLKAEIENVMNMGIKMRDEASNLSTALKGSSQQRGAWGEAQLERTLEMSGLSETDHYQKQGSFTDDDGKRKQPDYLIKLPGNKCIVIDSKLSLIAYERAVLAESEMQPALMNEHVAAVRQHVNQLASKEYTNLNGLHSPDFVLMFMPIEPAYIEAMKHDRDLFSFAYQRNVILVSHTTLIPILRTVANLWMLDRSNKEARAISERAADIYNSVALVSERLQKLGKTLNTASGHFNDTVTSLSGVKGLQGKVQRFTELSNKAKKTMPELEPGHIEFDTSKLEAHPVPESSQDDDDT